ncbi:MAG TPA: radical SAM protein [Ktedonobacterales bacterium]|nr:radical SAM protein [Ktedonobacterales bacterium]
MRILLVSPASNASLIALTEVGDITGHHSYMPNLALPTLAALAPDDVEITIVDEQVTPIDFTQHWDLVGITGYTTHQRRMLDIADEFRRRGQLVAIGGPYASLSPGHVRPHTDILFVGEAEETWPQFLREFRAGYWQPEYRAVSAIDLRFSPVPDIQKLPLDAYLAGVVQTSRGCPFECDFCDVIIYLGRKQRHKSAERVIQELEQWYEAGYRSVFLSDDNFTVNRRHATEVMTAIAAWNQSVSEPIDFYTQFSIDIARDQDTELLELCARAGLKQAFIGLESPNADALREVKKRQNLRSDLIADVHRVQQHGIVVQAGIITGFDADTSASFRSTFEFLQEAGIPIVIVNIMQAPQGTSLADRLLREGRLIPQPFAEHKPTHFHTNIIAKGMSHHELVAGTVWLLNRLYAPEMFLERCRVLAKNLPESHTPARTSRRALEVWQRLLASYTALGPEFSELPRQVLKLFRHRETQGIGTALIHYKHVVATLRRDALWNSELGQRETPDFSIHLPDSDIEEASHA